MPATKSVTQPATGTTARLAGSSAPTGAAPHVIPLGSDPKKDPIGLGRLRRPMMRSAKERLAELVDEYDRAIDFWNATGNAEDDQERPAEERDQCEIASVQATRILAELQQMIQALPASDLHDLGLKARAVSWSERMAWEEGREPGLCNLVEDILLLAGMDRIRPTDFPFADLLPGYTGPARYSAAADAVQSDVSPPSLGARVPTTLLERLAQEYAAAADRLHAFDLADAKVELDTVADTKYERLWNEAHEQISAIEASATYLEATSAKDALFQTILAFDAVDGLHACANAVEGSEDPVLTDTLYRRLERLLYSIRGVLEQLAAVSGDEISGRYVMEARNNPFRGERLARVLAEARAVERKGSDDEQVAA